jgi:hypothetical protein
VAAFRIGFNEGSLLRRTLLHVGTFVLGSVAFIGLLSFVLVSIAKGIVSPHADGAAADEPEPSTSGGTAVAPRAPRAGGALPKPLHNRRGMTPTPTPAPAGKDE